MPSSTFTDGRITCPLAVVILSVCLGSSFQFYSNSVTNNLADVCQKWINASFYHHYGHYITSDSSMSLVWSFCSAALQIGCLLGAAFTGFLADHYGRRRALMITSWAGMIGAVFNGIAKFVNSFELFIVGRLLLGVSLGCGLPLASIFISEISPVRYRGACGATQQITTGFGNVLSLILTLSEVFGSDDWWPVAVSVVPFMASMLQFLVLRFYAHDSPRFLILRDDKQITDGLDALKFYQGNAGAEVRLEAIKNEKIALDKQNGKEKFQFMDLFGKPENRRPLVISLLIIFGVQMSGVSAVLAYSKIMFEQAGLDEATSQYASLGIGLCNFLSPLLTMFLAEKAGRKFILLTGLSTVDVALIALTMCLICSNQYGWLQVAVGAIPCLYVYQVGFALAVSIAMIAPAELFPQNARASAMTIVFFLSWTLQTLCTLCYLPFSQFVGASYSYLPLITSVTFSITLLAIMMPETKGKTVETIAAIFDRNNDASSQRQSYLHVTRF